jgi:glucosamine--fructose-6-phosphate aminotransferase (isomerizing)
LAGYKTERVIGSQSQIYENRLQKGDLVIALSQSGETMDTLEFVRTAKTIGCKIFSLVNTVGSSLYRISDYTCLINAGPERSVASTKAVTAKIANLIILSKTVEEKNSKEAIKKGLYSTKRVLEKNNLKNIYECAEELRECEHIYVIGRGYSYPVSLEVALKIKEISYIHAEAILGGEMKHGPLALIEKGSVCIVFLPKDEMYKQNLAGIMEIKARGGKIVGIAEKEFDGFDFFLPVSDAEEATAIPNIITGQLLAYYLTKMKGLDPDRPRNLAKSVTVK